MNTLGTISDTVIVSASGFMTLVFTSFWGWFIARKADEAKAAALVASEKVELAKEISHEEGEHIRRKIEEVHGLVNGQMGLALQVNLDLARKIAARGGTPEDIQAVVDAENKLIDHRVKQAIAAAAADAAEREPPAVPVQVQIVTPLPPLPKPTPF